MAEVGRKGEHVIGNLVGRARFQGTDRGRVPKVVEPRPRLPLASTKADGSQEHQEIARHCRVDEGLTFRGYKEMAGGPSRLDQAAFSGRGDQRPSSLIVQ